MPTVFDVVSGVYTRLASTSNIPTTLSAGSIADLATDRLEFIAQFTETTLDSGNFAARYLGPVRDLVAADIIAARSNSDIDTEISVGNIRLAYSDKHDSNTQLTKYFLERAAEQLNNLGGGPIRVTVTTKAI